MVVWYFQGNFTSLFALNHSLLNLLTPGVFISSAKVLPLKYPFILLTKFCISFIWFPTNLTPLNHRLYTFSAALVGLSLVGFKVGKVGQAGLLLFSKSGIFFFLPALNLPVICIFISFTASPSSLITNGSPLTLWVFPDLTSVAEDKDFLFF